MQLADMLNPSSEVSRRCIDFQQIAYRQLSDKGLRNWWGAFIDGEQVGRLGLFFFERVGRFQSVITAEHQRNKGVCKTLVAKVTKDTAELWDQLVMVADESHHALHIYEALGFRPQVCRHVMTGRAAEVHGVLARHHCVVAFVVGGNVSDVASGINSIESPLDLEIAVDVQAAEAIAFPRNLFGQRAGEGGRSSDYGCCRSPGICSVGGRARAPAVQITVAASMRSPLSIMSRSRRPTIPRRQALTSRPVRSVLG
jgi:hypothetical protein